MIHNRHCRHTKGALCDTASQVQAVMRTKNVFFFPIKDTSMSSLCGALPVLLATTTGCVHTCAVSGHRDWCVNNRSVYAPFPLGYIFKKNHVPVSSYVRHSLHNPPSATSTFPSLQSNSPKLLATCLLHTFLCPVYPDKPLLHAECDESAGGELMERVVC